ncbi:efflux RND transporter periplasmic adaptor subunit [Pontibaca salina]|uniref:Efflux RND transporter periplasmic adaptor subunit n=1 Tax=Pontibaca salina TaxID=2795731 RepID=A0A934HI17_9RHOB|nr:efflux RND transporter periplasmic adaptor subunit [Pontibaca salina]MBI6628548.1 efflux RND transporter periplasmic adaptor subunit [Pontibaca salina]
MIKRLVIAVIALSLVVVGIVGFERFRSKMIDDFLSGREAPAVTVPVYEVEPRPWTPVISAIGTVVAVRGVELTVEAAGIVTHMGFSANEIVEEGQLLVRLDDAVQVADLNAGRTQARLDEQALERTKELRERGVTSGVSLDESQARAESSRAQVAKLEAVLTTKRLRAPFGGTIGIPQVDLGSYVTPGTVIATLQDLDTLYVDFKVPEQQFPLLKIGQTVNAGPEEGALSMEGKISGIDPRINPATRLVSVRAEVDNGDAQLVPGQFVQVEVQLPLETDVLTIPQTALVSSLYGDHVYVVREAEQETDRLVAQQVFVTAGRRTGGMIEVVDGLEPGASVITAGQNRLSNGAPVNPSNDVSPDVSPDGELGKAETSTSEAEPDKADAEGAEQQGAAEKKIAADAADAGTHEPDVSEPDTEKATQE